MPLSRLRLRLAGWFALSFVAGLLALSLTFYFYMHDQSDRRFNRQLAEEAGELVAAIRLEYLDQRGGGVAGATTATLAEWPARAEAFAIYDAAGRRLATVGAARLVAAFPFALPAGFVTPADRPGGPEHGTRLAMARSSAPAYAVLVASTTERLDEDAEALALWLALSGPAMVLISLVAGYALSRRALRPVKHLEDAIAGIAPSALDRRLPVNARPDELDRVAVQFNALLERLEQSLAQNRRFLQQAAHQIRTPLTLVLGESELALEQPRSPEAQAAALRRIRLAAAQMSHRVDELLLLARAEAGERVPLTDLVELDGLALECADLMRGRAHALGRRLELTRVDAVSVIGSEPLLREAVVELLENACRHGGSASPIRLSACADGGEAVLAVENATDGGAAPRGEPGHGLGLQVVRWIATEHGGRLMQRRENGTALHALHLPLAPAQGAAEPLPHAGGSAPAH